MYFFKKVLYVVGIPIGNIFDFSQRAIFILKNVDIVATEDSRKAGLLLKFLNIKSKMISFNSYNEIALSNFLLYCIKNNISIALISDSGTPLLSDPGFFLIDLFYKNNIKIIAIPGISSLSTVLSISIFNIYNFIFEGFLPKKKIYKNIFLKQFFIEKKVIIFFESSKRLLDTLFMMKHMYSFKRRVFIAKDLTKLFEKVLFFELGLLYEIIDKNNFHEFKKGECIILLEGVEKCNSVFLDYYITIVNYIFIRDENFLFFLTSSNFNNNLFYNFFFN